MQDTKCTYEDKGKCVDFKILTETQSKNIQKTEMNMLKIIFIPKIPSYRISDVATAIGPDCKQGGAWRGHNAKPVKKRANIMGL